MNISFIFELNRYKLKIKEELYKASKTFVVEKRSTLDQIMISNQKALENESKSSAGDKHETGRAMLHLEMEKASQQIKVIATMQEILEKIDPDDVSDHVKLGSLILTDQGKYYLSISAGLIKVENQDYYAVSAASPIGKLLLGESKGSIINMAAKQITVLDVQ